MDKKGYIPYHSLSINETLKKLGSQEGGLDDKQAIQKYKKSGPNIIEDVKQKSLLQILWEQINNPVIYLLLGAFIVSLFFGDIPEAIAIIVVIVLNAGIGFWMEYQARESVNALKRFDKLKAHVKRNNHIVEINAEEIVPGDIIILEAGDIIPADARVIYSKELSVDESPLTGESLPVEKNSNKLKEKETPLADRTNMLYKGTAVTSGKAHAVIVATGKETEIGVISQIATGESKEQIPLNKKLRKLSHRLIWATVGMALLFFLFGWLAGKEIYLLLQTAIAWTVAAIPEGLPIVASIALAKGMLRLAKKNVIVKKLAAVETLGETTVIFTDKTGTLTENKLSVTSIEYPGNKIETKTLFQQKDKKSTSNSSLQNILKVAVFCNDAEQINDKKIKGDPLDISLIEFMNEYNPGLTNQLTKKERIHEDPFDSDAKFMGTIHAIDERLYISCKGAAEPVLSRCGYYLKNGKQKKITQRIKKKWLGQNNQLSGKGLKVIACSYQITNEDKKNKYLQKDDFVHHMIFLGFICFADPAKGNVSDAIETCHNAGIKVVMVTGDHAGTARNIAQKVKLLPSSENEYKIMEGNEIDKEADKIYGSDLFARVDPKQKHKIVEHFKEKGEITAMTGDGVNDAPALKKADIGIAMGKRGTQIAQDVADMILKDDSFSSIVDAIEEGRIIFGNIRKFIIYQLSYHLAEIIIIAGISFSLFQLPLFPLQLLFLNLLSDVFPALALGLGKGNKNIMQQKPKAPEEPIINKTNWISMLIYGAAMAIIISGVYVLSIYSFNWSKEVANTIAFFGLAFSQLLHVFNMREPQENIFRNQIIFNKYIWIALALCITVLFTAYFIPLLHNALSFEYLTLQNWLLVIIASFSTLFTIQFIKNIFNI